MSAFSPGDKINSHLKWERGETLMGIELERRPPTNRPGDVYMAFGRAAPGYYEQRYPSKHHPC